MAIPFSGELVSGLLHSRQKPNLCNEILCVTVQPASFRPLSGEWQ